jgi:hypothetical protein
MTRLSLYQEAYWEGEDGGGWFIISDSPIHSGVIRK